MATTIQCPICKSDSQMADLPGGSIPDNSGSLRTTTPPIICGACGTFEVEVGLFRWLNSKQLNATQQDYLRKRIAAPSLPVNPIPQFRCSVLISFTPDQSAMDSIPLVKIDLQALLGM